MSTASADSELVGLTRSLVDIDSTTGREGAAAAWLSGELRRRGWRVSEQAVDGPRVNLFATDPDVPRPSIVFSTHLDCVPPFFPSRLDGDRIVGRGACDAKGILAAQIVAAERLRREGGPRVGLLFVVGEERGGDGARAANGLAPGSRYLVNGEPTDNRLGLATRGVYRVVLRAQGRAAHSSFPDLGESAIDKLLDALMVLRGVDLPTDDVLGRTHYTIGLIAGGVAPNVVSPSAEAEVMFRTVGAAADLRRAMAPIERAVVVDDVTEMPPVRLRVVPGFDTAVFPYATDIPFLGAWGEPLLYGPGSIHVAHTAEEFVTVGELCAAVDGYARIAHHLSQGSDGGLAPV